MSKAKAPAAKKKVVYLVVRQALGVITSFGLGYTAEFGSYDDDPRDVPVRGFAKKADAEAFAREQDGELRATFPLPLLLDAMGEFAALRQWLPPFLAAHGLPPIELGTDRRPHSLAFRVWWAKHAAGLTAEQKVALWEPFVEMRFHHVREIELED